MTGCPMYFAGISAGAAAAIGAAGSVAGGLLSSGSAKSATGKQAAAAESASKQQLYLAQEAYNERIRAVEEANRLSNEAYSIARPELTGGYTAAGDILQQTYGTLSSAGRAASGTSPEQLRQLQENRNAILAPYQAAGNKIEQLMAALKGMRYNASSAAQITELQNQVNEATRVQQSLKPQLDQLDAALSAAQPYTPGQQARVGFNDTYDYAKGTAKGQSATPEGIRAWIQQNPGATSEDIMVAMRENGISVGQLAAATGWSEDAINGEIAGVKAAAQGTAPTALINAAEKTTGLLNAGYDAAGNYINIGYDQAGNLIKTGYDKAGGIIEQGYVKAGDVLNKGIDAAIDYQTPYYDTGVRALGTMEKMITPGNQYLPQDPGYQFRLEQGNQAINNAAAARGNLLSGATLKALDSYSSGLASQEFQNAFSRWNELATKGQSAGNVISGLEQGRGTGLANLATGSADARANLATGQATNLANLATGRATNLSGLATERGINLGNVQSNLGNNLSTLYTHYGDTMSGNAINQGNALANLTLNQGNTLSDRALGNADFYAKTVGGLGQQLGQNTINAGDARAAGIVGGSNAIIKGLDKASNSLLQGLYLSGNQRQSGYRPDGSYYNTRYIP